VLHLAARVGVRLVLEQPSATLETNAVGTSHVLGAAARHGARVFLASSSEVYGKHAHPPFGEEDPLLLGATCEPRWSYACSKALGEWQALAHAREHGLAVLIVRFFNVVGPRQRPDFGMVLPRFVRAALRGEPLLVYGDGSQTRCFLHVEDALDAVLGLWDEPRAWGRVFNVGSTEELSVGELAERVRRAAGSDSPLVRVPLREAYGVNMSDFPRRLPDLTRLRALVPGEPRHGLDAVVAQLLAEQAARSPDPACPLG